MGKQAQLAVQRWVVQKLVEQVQVRVQSPETPAVAVSIPAAALVCYSVLLPRLNYLNP